MYGNIGKLVFRIISVYVCPYIRVDICNAVYACIAVALDARQIANVCQKRQYQENEEEKTATTNTTTVTSPPDSLQL